MAFLDSNRREAARLLGAYSGGHFTLGGLFGPVKATCRAHILSALTGEKVAKSNAGWNALRLALFDAFAVPSDCLALMEDSLSEIAREASKPAKGA